MILRAVDSSVDLPRCALKGQGGKNCPHDQGCEDASKISANSSEGDSLCSFSSSAEGSEMMNLGSRMSWGMNRTVRLSVEISIPPISVAGIVDSRIATTFPVGRHSPGLFASAALPTHCRVPCVDGANEVEIGDIAPSALELRLAREGEGDPESDTR